MSSNCTSEKKWNNGVMEEWNIGWFEKRIPGAVFCNFHPSFHYSTIPWVGIAVWNSEGRYDQKE
jgi:hypothetical protein